MSRAAQEMQRIADEMTKARRQPIKKGREAVDDLEDVTQGEPSAPAQDAPAAAATEETVAKTSAQRSKEWRDKQKKAKPARKAKTARTEKAATTAAAPSASDKASVKAETGGGKIKGGRTVFVTVPLALATAAFNGLLGTLAGADRDAVQKIVDRLA